MPNSLNLIEQDESFIVLKVAPAFKNKMCITFFSTQQGRQQKFIADSPWPLMQQGDQGVIIHTYVQKCLERTKSHAHTWFHCPQRLLSIQSLCDILHEVLPLEAPYPQLYKKIYDFLTISLHSPSWLKDYLVCEKVILQNLGFGEQSPQSLNHHDVLQELRITEKSLQQHLMPSNRLPFSRQRLKACIHNSI